MNIERIWTELESTPSTGLSYQAKVLAELIEILPSCVLQTETYGAPDFNAATFEQRPMQRIWISGSAMHKYAALVGI